MCLVWATIWSGPSDFHLWLSKLKIFPENDEDVERAWTRMFRGVLERHFRGLLKLEKR